MALTLFFLYRKLVSPALANVYTIFVLFRRLLIIELAARTGQTDGQAGRVMRLTGRPHKYFSLIKAIMQRR